MRDTISINTNDYEHAMSIVNWCKETFDGNGGQWMLYLNPGWKNKYYELQITPYTEQVEMLVRLKWL